MTGCKTSYLIKLVQKSLPFRLFLNRALIYIKSKRGDNLENLITLSYKELPPKGLLTDFVKCFWWADNPTDITKEFTILPDGCFGLIFQFHGSQLQTVFLKGIWTKPFEIIIPPNSTFFAIRFKPLAAESILLFRINEIVDQNMELEEFFWEINALNFNDLNRFSDLLTAKILSVYEANGKVDERKKKLFDILFETKGSLSVDNISKSLFWSDRQINRYFTHMFGLSLKSYCNILKVYSSYSQIARGDFYPEQDYYDQAHFIKNVRQYTGTNPKKLYANKKDRFIQLAILDKK